MLRSLLSSVLRSGSRAGSTGPSGSRGGYGSYGHSGSSDPGSAVGAAVGRSLFSRLRRR